MAALSVSLLPLEGIVLEHVLPGVVYRWSGASPSMTKTAGLGGVVQRGLDDGRVMVDLHREGA
jgi:hypothetical protein